jgi:hypothetical protein
MSIITENIEIINAQIQIKIQSSKCKIKIDVSTQTEQHSNCTCFVDRYITKMHGIKGYYIKQVRFMSNNYLKQKQS